MQLLDGQKALKNPGATGAKDLMEVDTLPGNEEFGREDEIVAKIERLKKEQKKAQMKTKLHCLREHKAQGFVKNVFEEESYTYRLALKTSKKVRDSDLYLEKSQYTLDKFVSQADLIFQTKPLTYAREEVKCLSAVAFLSGILKRE